MLARPLLRLAMAVCFLHLGDGAAHSNERDQLPGILGKDDRVILDNHDFPWSAVGRLNRGGRGFCTGTLVDHNIVLTAAHCLYDGRSGRRLQPHELIFLAGYRRGEYLAVGRVQNIIEPPEFSAHARTHDQHIAHDWALLLLTRKLPLRPLPVRALLSPETQDAKQSRQFGITAGYSQDRAHLLSLQTSCKLTSIANRGKIIVHTCDATYGASGSPLMIETTAGYTIVGVVVGAVDTSQTEKGLAVAASAFADSLDELRHRRR